MTQEIIETLRKHGELAGPKKLRFKAKYNYEHEFTLEWSIMVRTETAEQSAGPSQ